MTSWADPQQLLLLFSLVLLAAWALGGRFEIKGFKVNDVSPFSRILCVTTGVGLLFVWLMLVFASATSTPQDPSPVSPQPQDTEIVEKDLLSIHKSDLMSAIRDADDAEIAAVYSLDPNHLYPYFTGAALQDGLASLQELALEDVFLDQQLHDQRFESFSVSLDETHAEVRLTETWSSALYSISTQECIAYIPEHEAPQTISLDRINGAWMVSRITHHSSSPGFIAGCN